MRDILTFLKEIYCDASQTELCCITGRLDGRHLKDIFSFSFFLIILYIYKMPYSFLLVNIVLDKVVYFKLHLDN